MKKQNRPSHSDRIISTFQAAETLADNDLSHGIITAPLLQMEAWCVQNKVWLTVIRVTLVDQQPKQCQVDG